MSAISDFLEGAKGAVLFSELAKELEIPLVAGWLEILLGGFWVEQQGGFYDQNVWIETGA